MRLSPLIAAPFLHLVVGDTNFKAASGVRPWVDIDTPADRQTVTTSRGDVWELVMSDEFNTPNRSFVAGDDHLWTALDLADGVNAALEYYSPNMTSTVTLDDDDKTGVFQIEIRNDVNITFDVYNGYANPPGYETHSMYYRSGMVQSWNKFCFQGGRMEVRAKLPGAVSSASKNPDVVNGSEYSRVEEIAYYPTWPGIWLMGNLGRALFTGSTNRMWPWSYNECDDEYAPNQRISACDDNPGYGLNPNQGRGAVEIDLLEGGGTALSTSIQIAPGMPKDYRLIEATNDSNSYCIYGGDCTTEGANFLNVPTKVYEARGHKSWYQGLRYAPNGWCAADSSIKQNFKAVNKSVSRGIVSNTCEGVNTCPGSYDGNSDLGLIDGNGDHHWGINYNGGCMPKINAYMGAFLCDPDNTDKRCSDPRKTGNATTSTMKPFSYQMDAISANTEVPLKTYTGFIDYQLEWVTGDNGWVRWQADGQVLFEIPASSIINVPEGHDKSNPKKVFPEEPMYMILNVALATSWGATPPNAGDECWGDRKDEQTNRICDSFPMYMQVDYIRLYQDVSFDSDMSIGCDPSTHPTKEWIDGHISEYEDIDNKWVEVTGGASCRSDRDCSAGTVGNTAINTGRCGDNNRCYCFSPATWGGPRCSTAIFGDDDDAQYGPNIIISGIVGGIAFCALLFVALLIVLERRRLTMDRELQKTNPESKKGARPFTENALMPRSNIEFGSKGSASQLRRKQSET